MVDSETKAGLELQFADNFASEIFTDLVDAYIEDGNYTRARSVCEIGLSYHPEHPDGLFLLSQITMAESDLEGAEKLLQVLLSGEPRHKRGAHLLVTIQERLSRPVEVLRQGWEHLLALDPENSQARVFLKRLGVKVSEPAPHPAETKSEEVKPASKQPEAEPAATTGTINTRMATFTLMAVLKDQGLYHQALEVLNVLEEKGNDPERIKTEREQINQQIQNLAGEAG